MKFKQMTSLVALSFLFLSAEAFAGKDDPIEGKDKGGSGKVTATPKSSGAEVKTTDSADEGTSTSAKGPVLLEQNSAVVEADEVSGAERAAQKSPFGDLTHSVFGFARDTRGTVEWLAPQFLGGKTRLHDILTLRGEIQDANAPEVEDKGYSFQVTQFIENGTDPILWPRDTRAWYSQTESATDEWNREEAKRLMNEGVFNVRAMPFPVQKLLVDSETVRYHIKDWAIENGHDNKLNYRKATE